MRIEEQSNRVDELIIQMHASTKSVNTGQNN